MIEDDSELFVISLFFNSIRRSCQEMASPRADCFLVVVGQTRLIRVGGSQWDPVGDRDLEQQGILEMTSLLEQEKLANAQCVVSLGEQGLPEDYSAIEFFLEDSEGSWRSVAELSAATRCRSHSVSVP